MKTINIGLIGLGTVGCNVVKLLEEKKEVLEKKAKVKFNLKKIADKNLDFPRPVKVSPEKLTSKIEEVLDDPQIEIIIELIGGIEEARTFLEQALKNKKSVVTANKALLAEYGEEIFKLAQENGVRVNFEASVGGGIPIIRSLREGLIANKIESIFGIINGTANYILTRMSKENKDFNEALKEAQEAGYAESDSSLDLEGVDSAHKLVILASLAFGTKIELKEVYVEGITKITLQDIKYAQGLGYIIKLLAIAKESNEEIEVRVHPTMIPQNSLLASVNEEFNAVYVTGDVAGPVMFYGRGAGGASAASAVVSDLIDLTRRERANSSFVNYFEERKKIKKIEELVSPCYIRFSVIDQPGVLAKISGILGKNKISIASVIQKGRKEGDVVPIVMMTHKAKELNIQKALKEIDKLGMAKAKSVLIRMEE
jgi:homoserine dehydrogenase